MYIALCRSHPLLVLFGFQLILLGAPVCRAGDPSSKDCRVERTGDLLTLSNQYFRWTIDISAGLKAVQCENLLTGARVDLHGGEEASLRFFGPKFGDLVDARGRYLAGQQRIELGDWKKAPGGGLDKDPNHEDGFTAGFLRSDLNDLEWRFTHPPWASGSAPNPSGYNWFRHRVYIPANAMGRPVCFGLGGSGLSDFGNHRFFLNGVLIGEREIEEKWNEPEIIRLNPGGPGYDAIRFSQHGNNPVNVLAVQAWNLFDQRSKELRELDPGQFHQSNYRYGGLQEQFVAIGEAYKDVDFVKVTNVDIESEGDQGRVCLTLQSSLATLSLALLWYEWSADEPALRKWFEFSNIGGPPDALLQVNLGNYLMDLPSSRGTMGFPVYLNDEIFFGISNPAGVAHGGFGTVRLFTLPGKPMWPKVKYTSKQAVIGFGGTGGARQAFFNYILERAPRKQQSGVLWNGFGSVWCKNPKGWVPTVEPPDWQVTDPPTEGKLMAQFDKMEELQNSMGLHFDYCWIDHGWTSPQVFPFKTGQNYAGFMKFNLDEFSYTGWPDGPERMIDRIHNMGMKIGIWFAGHSCDALEDSQLVWRQALKHHILINKVDGFKFDPPGTTNDWSLEHNHMPGKYSREPKVDAAIRSVYGYARELKPDIFLQLYGGNSPWWLLWHDTMIGRGIGMEAATLSYMPTLFVRDSIAISIDQAAWYSQDLPSQGKDSLGVWVSPTLWNNHVGRDHWLPHFVLDISRGSALAQPWFNLLTDDIHPDEMPTFVHLTRLLKRSPDCFLNTKALLGSPWKEEPYGYLGSNGQKSFLTVNNPTWVDQLINIELGPEIGLESGKEWEVYMHFPVISRVAAGTKKTWRTGERLSWYQSPFEVVLLEITPEDEGSVMKGPWEELQLPVEPMDQPAYELPLEHGPSRPARGAPGSERIIRTDIPACSSPAVFALVLRMTQEGLHWERGMEKFSLFDLQGAIGGEEVGVEGAQEPGPIRYSKVPERQGPSWLVFKIPVPASPEARQAGLVLRSHGRFVENVPENVEVKIHAYIIPEFTRKAGRFL
jgi:hypothetical protein